MWNHIKAELLKAQERYLCGELDERELDILVNHTFLPVDRRK